MNNSSKNTKPNLVRLKEKSPLLLVMVVVVGGVWVMINESKNKSGTAGIVAVNVPQLSTVGQQGEKAFAVNCADCHGKNAAGGSGGPPLIHQIYVPGHHADGAFYLAFQRGVPQHHWQFGNMPPQPQINKGDADAIIRYVREVQVANGIGG